MIDNITGNTTQLSVVQKLNEVITFLRGGGNLVGSVIMFSGTTIPDKCLLCDGSALSRTVYAALFAVIGTSFGAGDGRTTFNLPNLIGRVAQGATTAGEYKEAGLPEIFGGIQLDQDHVINPAGAFSETPYDTSIGHIMSGNLVKAAVVHFNASRYNAIYGNSTTVQPPALTQKFCIKYA